MPRPIPPHGTPSRYHGPRRGSTRWPPCRCEACATAARRARKRQESHRLRGRPRFADAAPASARIRSLLAAGWTQRAIAHGSGLTCNTIADLADGKRQRIRHETAARLLALPAPALRPASRVVDGLGSSRRVRALSVLGWPMEAIAQRAGISRQTVQLLALDRSPRIRPRTARAIAEAYRTLSTAAGPCGCSRTVAARNGWHGPLAWDDIDDPACEPDIENVPEVQLRPSAVAEDAAELQRLGVDRDLIAQRLGMTRGTLDANLRRAGARPQREQLRVAS